MWQLVRQFISFLYCTGVRSAFARSPVKSQKFTGPLVLVLGVLLFSPQIALAQFVQQGSKLVGSEAIGPGQQGRSVALSDDGNTAIVGAPEDDNRKGAAWIFTRRIGAWTQQQKLVVPDAIGAYQGWSVALSADARTAIVGGFGDDRRRGAAWVYTRSRGSWTLQQKLVDPEAVHAEQGISVALSADGNTAIVGGHGYDNLKGAAWVYTRSRGTWTLQQKLVASDAIGAAHQGWSAALSADGNTAIIGGRYEDGRKGAAWVFTRDDGTWTLQQKLVGSEAIGAAHQGWSAALSADGHTAIVGGPFDGSRGAAWVFTRSSGGIWTQQTKLVVGSSTSLGSSVALSANGDTAIIGGFYDGDDGANGAAWFFTRDDGTWTQQQRLVGSGAVGPASQGSSVALSARGDTAIVGGRYDESGKGAAWVFYVRRGTSVGGINDLCLKIVPTNFGVQVAVVDKLCGLSPFPDIVFENWLTVQPLHKICWAVRGLPCPGCQPGLCPTYDLHFRNVDGLNVFLVDSASGKIVSKGKRLESAQALISFKPKLIDEKARKILPSLALVVVPEVLKKDINPNLKPTKRVIGLKLDIRSK